MPLQTSGPISINDLKGEFGDTPGDDRMSEYYAGAGYTPAGCEGTGGPVPASGEVRMSDFYGACIVVAPPNTYLETVGRGPDVSGIFPLAASSYGYSYYCLETSTGVWEPGFGSYTGDRFLDGGGINEGFYSVVYLAENAVVSNSGINFLMFNDAFTSTDYRFDVEIRTISGTLLDSRTLFSASATADDVITARYGTSCGSTRNVRQIYFDMGTTGPGGTHTDLQVDVQITRT